MSDDTPRTELAENIHELGITIMEAGRLREAALLFRKAIVVAPNFSDAAICLGHCLHQQEQYTEALEVYDRLLTTCPASAAVWNNRATTLLAMCRYDEAAENYRQAVAIMPGLHDVQIALATCYQAMGKCAEAEEICDKVLSNDHQHAEAHWNRALLLLLKGDYLEGWHEYEWRWQKRGFTSPRRDFPQPAWRGESIAGRTILIHAEQGFGDTLQFCRYVPLVANLGAQVVFECQPQLATLMETLGGNILVVKAGDQRPLIDLQIPLMSLAGIFKTAADNIPCAVPYLKPPGAAHSSRQSGSGIKVGLCWSGKAYPDPMRSCPAEILVPLSKIKGVSWHSLQVGWDKALPFPMFDNTGQISDFADTAAIIAQLDLVITIDTAVAHLAGALGKPTWTLLPYAPDWRWLNLREDSPWYPAMQLFRQNRPGSWQDVIRRVEELLKVKAKVLYEN